MKFTIRDLLWAILVVSLVVYYPVMQSNRAKALEAERRQLDGEKEEWWTKRREAKAAIAKHFMFLSAAHHRMIQAGVVDEDIPDLLHGTTIQFVLP